VTVNFARLAKEQKEDRNNDKNRVTALHRDSECFHDGKYELVSRIVGMYTVQDW
jgi:hypothetical protein